MSYSSALGRGTDRLRHLAAGWVDTEMLTIRRMAADGASAVDIAAAVGSKPDAVVRFIKRNKLVWNWSAEERHQVLSASSRFTKGLPIDVSWRPTAEQMRRDGATFREIAETVGRSSSTVQAWLRKSDPA